MMRYLILLALLLCLPVHGEAWQVVSSGPVAVYHQGFESNETCATLGITPSGTVSCQFSTSGLDLEGSYTSRLDVNSTLIIPLPSSMTEVVVVLRVRFADALETSEYQIQIIDSGGSNIIQGIFQVYPDGIRVTDGTSVMPTSFQTQAGNSYWIKLRYKAGSGSDGEMSIAGWSGSSWVSASSNSLVKTAAAASLRLRNNQDSAGVEYWYYDDIYIFDEDITGNPNAL